MSNRDILPSEVAYKLIKWNTVEHAESFALAKAYLDLMGNIETLCGDTLAKKMWDDSFPRCASVCAWGAENCSDCQRFFSAAARGIVEALKAPQGANQP